MPEYDIDFLAKKVEDQEPIFPENLRLDREGIVIPDDEGGMRIVKKLAGVLVMKIAPRMVLFKNQKLSCASDTITILSGENAGQPCMKDKCPDYTDCKLQAEIVFMWKDKPYRIQTSSPQSLRELISLVGFEGEADIIAVPPQKGRVCIIKVEPKIDVVK